MKAWCYDMKVSGLKHIAVAVHDLQKQVELLSDVLGLPHSEITEVKSQGVKVAFIELPNARIEFIAPLDENANLNKFLERRGEGLHHIAISVDNVDKAISELSIKGVAAIDKEGRPGAEGKRVAFLHPKSTGGVLFELEEE